AKRERKVKNIDRVPSATYPPATPPCVQEMFFCAGGGLVIGYPAMTVMLVIAALALAILLAGAVALVGTMLLGIGTAAFKQTRFVSPIFLLIVPSTLLGAVAGCFGLGYWLITRVNENLLLWGPLLGLLVGAAAGASFGTLVSALIWWRTLR